MNRLNLISRSWLSVLAVVFCIAGLVISCESKKNRLTQEQVITPAEDEITKLCKAAEVGNSEEQYKLGLKYDLGVGVEVDAAAAVKWYRKAADQGNVAAQLALGDFYNKREGMTKDAVEAAKWYRKAADQGNVAAQLMLGFYYASGEGVNKDDVEAVGLVKFDFLGLRTLTIIDWALKDINAKRARRGEAPIDIERIPLDDPRPYQLMSEGKTTAVFQLESRGMKDYIKKLEPSTFEDLIALAALYRPGPLNSGMVDDFILRSDFQGFPYR